jgi:hypothetical protein
MIEAAYPGAVQIASLFDASSIEKQAGLVTKKFAAVNAGIQKDQTAYEVLKF